jgi:hypothetical protein
MSFVATLKDENYIVSFTERKEYNDFIILATNFNKDYFVEKLDVKSIHDYIEVST